MQISVKNKDIGKPVGNLKNKRNVVFLLPSLAFYLRHPCSLEDTAFFHHSCINRANR